MPRVLDVARRLGRGARRVWLAAGDAVDCPCCGGAFRHFLSYGVPPRPVRQDVRCPVCGSLERQRALAGHLLDAGLLGPDRRVLHVASEEAIERLVARLGALRHVRLDLRSERSDVHADLVRLPFPDATFDTIVCSHVLEHVPDDAAAMRELHRVADRGATVLVMVPTPRPGPTDEDPTAGPEDRVRRFGQADHVRWYGVDLAERLESAGFDVRTVTPATSLPEDVVERRRLGAGQVIYAASRPTAEVVP